MSWSDLWLRGGFPESALADFDSDSHRDVKHQLRQEKSNQGPDQGERYGHEDEIGVTMSIHRDRETISSNQNV